MYKFKKNQLVVALQSWTPYTPCLVITDIKEGEYVNCYSVGFRSANHLRECGKIPVRLCFYKEELRVATLSDILNNPFIYEQYRPNIKDFLKSMI